MGIKNEKERDGAWKDFSLLVQQTRSRVLEQVIWLLSELVGRNNFSTFVFPMLVLGLYSVSYEWFRCSRMYMWNVNCSYISRQYCLCNSVEQISMFLWSMLDMYNVFTVMNNILFWVKLPSSDYGKSVNGFGIGIWMIWNWRVCI